MLHEWLSQIAGRRWPCVGFQKVSQTRQTSHFAAHVVHAPLICPVAAAQLIPCVCRQLFGLGRRLRSTRPRRWLRATDRGPRFDGVRLIHASANRPRTVWSGGIATLLAATLAFSGLSACDAEEPMPQRTDPVQSFVSVEIPDDATAVNARLREFFNDGTIAAQPNRFDPDDRLHLFEAVPARSPIELQWVQAPNDQALARRAEADPALQRYLGLEPRQRELDLYLFQPTGPHYWPSEYQHGQRELPFSTGFLVHLQPLPSGRTRIEIIEVLPQVLFGDKWAWTKHGVGFARVQDVRAVAPTTRDRLELLARILAALDQTKAEPSSRSSADQ